MFLVVVLLTYKFKVRAYKPSENRCYERRDSSTARMNFQNSRARGQNLFRILDKNTGIPWVIIRTGFSLYCYLLNLFLGTGFVPPPSSRWYKRWFIFNWGTIALSIPTPKVSEIPHRRRDYIGDRPSKLRLPTAVSWSLWLGVSYIIYSLRIEMLVYCRVCQ